MQVKLLRVIQEGRVRKVGVDAGRGDRRAHHLRDAPAAARPGRCRQVSPGPVLPDQRDRAVDAAAARNARRHPEHRRRDPVAPRQARAGGVRSEAIAALQAYPFPGNVRELENILERALALASDPRRITIEDLHLSPSREEEDSARCRASQLALQDYLDQLEKRAIIEGAGADAEQSHGGGEARWASRSASMRYRMERLGIN